MKDVSEMSISECLLEVCEVITRPVEGLTGEMSGAHYAIRHAGWEWYKDINGWFAGRIGQTVEWVKLDSPTADAPALDLWRLAVLVWREASEI